MSRQQLGAVAPASVAGGAATGWAVVKGVLLVGAIAWLGYHLATTKN